MISSIFGKTKPINYIIILGFLFLFYWFVHFVLFQKSYEMEQMFLQTAVTGFLLFGIFIVNFIVKRNQITGTNSFTILYYALLVVVFPKILLDNNAVFCGFFLLLASRKLISLRSLKNMKLKIFDASIWVLVSSLFYDWALLYFILIFIAIYFYEPKNIRNWLVPIVAVVTIGLIAGCILILFDAMYWIPDHYQFALSIDTNFLANWASNSKLIMYTGVVIITGFLAFIRLGKLGIGRIITMRLIALSLAIGLVVTFLKTSSENYPVFITFFPAAVLLTKYVEVIKRINVKEMVLIMSVVAPFLVLITESILK